MNCPKCKARNTLSDYHGASIQAATERQEGRQVALVTGMSCILCGEWIEYGITSKTPPQEREYLTSKDQKEISTRVLYGVMRDIVKKHMKFIKKQRNSGIAWVRIVRVIMQTENRALTENTIKTHYNRLVA
jgi:hypothetical protein